MSGTLTEPRVREFGLTMRLNPVIQITDEQFFLLCQINKDLRLERNAEGDIIIMPPTGWETGDRNSELNMQLRLWAKRDGSGVATDSSTGFKLPNGADRSPDAAWVLRSRLAKITSEQRKKFLPLCPDFAIELLSPTDRLEIVQARMDEYMECGARLGWLIDPENRRVYVYRPGAATEALKEISEISGEPELKGFVFDLREIWEPDI